MLDPSILDQLRDVFSQLRSTLELRARPSPHAAQDDLLDLLRQLASTSEKIRVEVTGDVSDVPHVELTRDGVPTGVSFRGVPGGHEFTSLVVALLNADGRGRMPDAALTARIQALKPGTIHTYVSLECTNCPDVVQALNTVALLNPGVMHQAVDGALSQQDAARLGVQAVPSVFMGDTLVHVGKSTLGELVSVLEQRLGRREDAAPAQPVDLGVFDVAVIGGGPAGVAAAIYTARKGLKTAVIAQRMGGQLQDTLGIENFIGIKRTEGPRLSVDLREHLAQNDVTVLENRRVERVEDGARKTVLLEGGERVQAERIIMASGARWKELNVPGEREYLGRGVAFCPHCDGPFYKGKDVAVVGGGNSGVEAAIDLAGICRHVTLVEYADALKADAVLVEKLRALPNATVITGARTTEVAGDGSKVTALRYEQRATGEPREVKLDGVFVQIGLSPNSGSVKDLVELNRYGEIVVDGKGHTSVPGIYAAGDVTNTPYKQIVIAMGEGARVALAAFEDRMRAA